LSSEPPGDPSNAVVQSAAAISFGQQLFFDTELSAALSASQDGQPKSLSDDAGTRTQRVACADCHSPATWFSDDRSSPNNVSLGVGWTGRNSPSLVNVAQYVGGWAWDGRSDSLWMQCGVAYTAGATMAGTSHLMAKTILAKYADRYAEVFDAPLMPTQVYAI